ncbi:hypothetical protein VNO80_12701 [Phaseolus coccineus]|uniref:Uncharacterized protein n=1 Tax=Phaseolus coccineus TaxID=3886 RepID=A0AAN9RAU8_PHACN
MASLSILNSESDEENWVIQINQMSSETNHSILKKIPVCIYQVPKSLRSAKPEAFAPQLIAIGPYNHFCPELYPMERFKVLSAKAVLDHFQKHDLKQVVEEFRNTATFIRASYHKYLDLKDETLLYTVAIDALFLLNFYHNYLNDKFSGSFMAGLEDRVQLRGVKLTKDAIIRDILMVENQIPTYSLLKILVHQSSEPAHLVQDYLGSMLLSFCRQHSPLNLTHVPSYSEAVSKHHHVLDLMYHLVVSHAEKSETPIPGQSEGMYKLFDDILYLPVLKLDVNSEVIMRNLVAYEALTKPDFLIFTRYTELMREIVDTVEDVKLLKKAGIIESSSSLSVQETEELFNGMSKSIGPTKTQKLDETIKKVNKYYHDKRKTNFFRVLTEYVYKSWKLFTLLATFVLLAMTAIETFCAAYDCHRYFEPE